ncbi:MAG: hypothetical protein WC634_05680 [archaeon]
MRKAVYKQSETAFPLKQSAWGLPWIRIFFFGCRKKGFALAVFSKHFFPRLLSTLQGTRHLRNAKAFHRKAAAFLVSQTSRFAQGSEKKSIAFLCFATAKKA